MGDTALNVPVKVRTHELQQVKTMMPNVADSLEQADLDEAAEEVQRIFDTHIEGIDAHYPEGPESDSFDSSNESRRPSARDTSASLPSANEATATQGDSRREFAAYLSMPVEDWRLTIRYLNRARRTDGKLRAQWLQSKLVYRVEDRLSEMEGDDE